MNNGGARSVSPALMTLQRVARPRTTFLTLLAIASMILSVSVARASGGNVGYHGVPPEVPTNTKAKYLVLIVLDGARPEYLDFPGLPHLAALRTAGTSYTNAMAGILESETPTGHATISTGSSPRRSGILGFSWAQNEGNYSLFNPDVVRSGAIEHIMQNVHAPTIAGLYKARYPHAVVVALSGHKYYAADPLGGPDADVIMYFRGTLQKTYAPTAIPGHVPPAQVFNVPSLTAPLNSLAFGQDDHMATELALSAFANLRQRITLINYPDFDWPLGHVYGGSTDHARALTLMRIFDSDLGEIESAYRQAGILKQTLFVITADHGMAPLKRFVPQTIFDNAITKAGTTAPSKAFNTAAFLWLRNQAKAPMVAANILNAHDPGIDSVYYLASTGTSLQYVRAPGPALSPGVDAANRFLLSTLENGHQPTVVTFCRKGVTTSSATTHWRADHGGASWAVQHVPLILSGPGIVPGLVSTLPAQLEDVAPTVLTTMGVRPFGMEGHVLTEALTSPYSADQPKRNTEIARVSPLVQALIRQDATQTGG